VITKDIVVVGTGFSGMGAAVKLLESGRTDFAILEKADDVGGTWRDNTYPGCECDIPSHMYSFSWRLNPDWSRNFSAQPEIWAYMQKVADEKGIRPYIHFGVEVTGLAWDEDRSVWTVHTSAGEDYEARIVLSGVGGLHIPNSPAIDGAETFAGPRFDSAEWDHTVDLAGKKVAVIGTGASAIQFIPIIAEEVEHLTVFQRTPPWVLGKKDNAIHPVRQKFFDKVPGLTRAYRDAIYWSLEARAIAFNGHLNVLPYAEKLAKAKGITNGDLVKVSSNRGEIRAKAVVSRRISDMTCNGKEVYTVGIPIHWGFVGVTKNGFLANTLTPYVADANSQTPEYKSFLVNIEKA
jgi:cation diffusion facilitator CzcD-associated flavoprotein CzcO